MGFFSTIFGCKDTSQERESSEVSISFAVTSDDEHDKLVEEGTDMIFPHMKLLGRESSVTKKVRIQILEGIGKLDAVTKYNPQNWSAFWFKGKGYQLLEIHDSSNVEFKASFDIQKENPDVAREYGASCLEIGLWSEAIGAAQHAISLEPDSAGLEANLALALLLGGDTEGAKNAIDRSLQLDPTDAISKRVGLIVDEVISGERPIPKSKSDLYNS